MNDLDGETIFYRKKVQLNESIRAVKVKIGVCYTRML